MTIYVSFARPEDMRRERVKKAINLFSEKVEPCPSCRGEEFLLRFGSLPYLICLTCGWGGRPLMSGVPLNLSSLEGEIEDYLQKWGREGRRSSPDLPRIPGLDNILSGVIKITRGGEESRNYNAEPADSSYPSKIRHLGTLG
jgi:hypothetical protein